MEHEPRIAPLTREQFGPEALETLAGLRAMQSLPPLSEVPEFVATMLHHGDLFQKQIDLTGALFNGELDVRDRELAILRTTWLCQAPFVFGQHVGVSKVLCGFTTEDIERIIMGSIATEWDEHSRAILCAAEELHECAEISDATWDILTRKLNSKQLIELPVLVGQMHGVAFVQRSLRVRLMPGEKGLDAR